MTSKDNLQALHMSLTCQNCELGATRKNLVFGEGRQMPDFPLGRSSGAKKNPDGLLSAGRGVLTEMLTQAGLDRQDVYITGSCKCRPPKNRNPYKGSLPAAYPAATVRIIKPQVVVCMGLVAIHNLLDKKARLADIHGQWFEGRGIKFIPPIIRPQCCGGQ